MKSVEREYAVVPTHKRTAVMLGVIVAALPVGVFVNFLNSGWPEAPFGLWPGIMVSLLPAALLIPAFLRREVRFDGERLTVGAGMHTRHTEIAEFDLAAAEIVDLRGRRELRPLLRMFGFSLIGFCAGHYWTRARRRVFALVTTPERVLALPERRGTTILLSVEQPKRLLDDLRGAQA